MIGFVFSQSGKTWDKNVVQLPSVNRVDAGLYECAATDTETFTDVSGNMTLSINCKGSTLAAAGSKSAPASNSPLAVRAQI